jgi:threonine dehydratase
VVLAFFCVLPGIDVKDSSNNPLDSLTDEQLLDQLARETDAATGRIYALHPETSIDSVMLPSGVPLSLKREDISTVHSYKWRGSGNKISKICDAGFDGQLVAASAGNHAQGVAVVAARQKLDATIFMPLSTPLLKQESVRSFGGEHATIRLFGDSFDESQREAIRFAEETGGTFIPPYDDLDVIAGQSTIAVEFLEQLPELPTHVFIGIGGGGVAAGIASVIKRRHPEIQVIGVEGAGQDSMSRSIEAGELVTLETLDKFCDGTAVACPGELPFRLCSMLLDDCVRVSNDDACHAIQFLWQTMRVIVEPSAGLGVAAAMAWNFEPDDRPLAILSGSNVDFMMLPKIARLGQVQRPETRYYQFELSEQAGSLIGLLDQFFVNMNIIDFQYGQMSDSVAYPTIGVEVPYSALHDLQEFLRDPAVPPFQEVTGSAASNFRVIPFRVDLLTIPFFAVIEFSNRPGALREFMREASRRGNVCYMNYTDTGQTEGQALMGFDFADIARQTEFLEWLQGSEIPFQPVPIHSVQQLTSGVESSDGWAGK